MVTAQENETAVGTITAREVMEWAEMKPAGEVLWKKGGDNVTDCVTAMYMLELTGVPHNVGFRFIRPSNHPRGSITHTTDGILGKAINEWYSTSEDITAGMVVNTISRLSE